MQRGSGKELRVYYNFNQQCTGCLWKCGHFKRNAINICFADKQKNLIVNISATSDYGFHLIQVATVSTFVAKEAREFDMDKVKTTLKQFARDWSKEVWWL